MHKFIIYGMLLLLYGIPLKAQKGPGSSESEELYLSIIDNSIITGVDTNGKPVFSIPGINRIVNAYNVTAFKQAFPASRFEYLRQVYELTGGTAGVAVALQKSYPQYFPQFQQRGKAQLLADYYPGDYNHGSCRSDHLGYIGAPKAWGITHGDPNVIVGVTDTYFDLTNPDFAGQIASAGPNGYSNSAHGTAVAGMIAGKTDNGTTGGASIGFNTRLDVSNNWGNDAELLSMSARGRRVLNASWFRTASSTLDLTNNFFSQGVYNEIYENGTLSCFGAGNGWGSNIPPSYFAYPPSLNHVFATTNIGWDGVYGTDSFNVKDVHQFDLDDSDTTYQHNSRVDIMAPAIRLGALLYDANDPSMHYCWDCANGTSFASPIVAGTAALLLTKDCLTPYQLEYILKKTAKSSVLTLPENLKYAGRLGAGKLEAGSAVEMAYDREGDCNNPRTQTFIITGIELNTRCAPGLSSNGVRPKLTPLVKNGTAPYTYTWEPIAGNTTVLDNYNAFEPVIISSVSPHLAYYRLTVYDASDVQKVAEKVIKIKLDTVASYDLAMRDSYADMLDELNTQTIVDSREWNFCMSPDIWNRQLNDGVLTHENPEYFTTNPNFVYTRIRNTGCQTSPVSNLRLYWTKASTGEKWKNDWDGTMLVGSSGNLPIPGGGEITAGAPIVLAPLAPGQSAVITQPWYPTRPEDFFGSPHTVDVCLLARIEDPHGMTIPETFAVTIDNVRNNNNIITRNLIITNLNPANKTTGRHRIDVVSAEKTAQLFNLQFISDRTINPHHAGNFTAVGYVTLYLGDLFDRWKKTGAKGTYASINEKTKSVVFDGTAPLKLKDIELLPGERFPVDVEFSLLPGIIDVFENEFMMHFCQFIKDPRNPDKQVYGNVSFLVKTSMPPDDKKRQKQVIQDMDKKGLFAVYPNPSDKVLNLLYSKSEPVRADVAIYDVTGNKVFSEENHIFSSSPYGINIAQFTSGIYFITISDNNGLREKYKFVKQ